MAYAEHVGEAVSTHCRSPPASAGVGGPFCRLRKDGDGNYLATCQAREAVENGLR